MHRERDTVIWMSLAPPGVKQRAPQGQAAVRRKSLRKTASWCVLACTSYSSQTHTQKSQGITLEQGHTWWSRTLFGLVIPSTNVISPEVFQMAFQHLPKKGRGGRGRHIVKKNLIFFPDLFLTHSFSQVSSELAWAADRKELASTQGLLPA